MNQPAKREVCHVVKAFDPTCKGNFVLPVITPACFANCYCGVKQVLRDSIAIAGSDTLH